MEFSEMCKKVIQNSDMTIYKIAKISGLERTALNRMINGKRMMNPKDFEKFCKAVRMSKKDREKLFELYMIERDGKKKYENRKFIEKILQSMDTLLSMGEEKTICENGSFADWNLTDVKKNFKGRTIVNCIENVSQMKIILRHILHEAFQKEGTEIYTNIPTSFRDFFENMEYYYGLYHKKLSVYHYLMLHASPANYYNENYNLELLCDILPWIFSSHIEYHPYFSYSNSMLDDMVNTVMAYYLIADDCVLQMTVDMDKAILHIDPAVAALYRDKIQKSCRLDMEPIISEKCKIESIAKERNFNDANMGKRLYSFSSCPSLDILQPWKSIGKLSMEEGCGNYFSKAGLQYFCETGRVKAQVNSGFEELSIQQRQVALKRIMNELQNERFRFRITQDTMPVLWQINMDTYEHGVCFQLFYDRDPSRRIVITESSICESFRDFWEAMEDMSLLKNSEETYKQIKQCYQLLQDKTS